MPDPSLPENASSHSNDSTGEKSGPDIATADISLKIGARRMELKISIPVLPTPPSAIIGLARSIANACCGAIEEEATAKGTPVTCKAGCGACCRQLVPITAVESHALANLVASLPEPRQSEIRARFADAREKAAAWGKMNAILDRGFMTVKEAVEVGMDFFYQGIPCPFLENESCSIHPERPIICREYLVISPPEYCSDIRSRKVRGAISPANVSGALRHAETAEGDEEKPIPLFLALDWAEKNPEPPANLPGPQLVQRFFSELTGRKAPPAPGNLMAGG